MNDLSDGPKGYVMYSSKRMDQPTPLSSDGAVYHTGTFCVGNNR